MPWTCNRKRAEWRAKRRASDPDYVRRNHEYRVLMKRLRGMLPEMIEEQDGLCGICGELLPEISPDVHVDHKTARNNGGGDGRENLQAVHAQCNILKGRK